MPRNGFPDDAGCEAALPGLVGEMAADPTLHSALLGRFAGIIGGGLAELLERAAARGEVRADVTAARN